MENCIRNYSFGGIDMRLCLPRALMPQEPFSLFTIQDTAQDAFLCNVISAGDGLTELDGEEIYFNERLHVRVKKQQNITAVYLGFYRNSRETNREFAVILRDSNLPNEQSVYILDEFLQSPCERQIMSAMGIEHILARGGGFILHSSYIETHFGAVLFTAPKGTGKSTQAEIWRKYKNAEIINGDRTLITVKEDSITANGLPYCGSSGICKNKTLPIAAIVELSQAKENSISKLSGIEAFRTLMSGTWVNVWDSCDMTAITDTAVKIAEGIPMLKLACVPDVSAADLLEKELKILQGGSLL